MPATRTEFAGTPGVRGSVLLLVAVGLFLLLPRLGASGLWDPWEPRYAQTAREMAASGDWVVPHYREDPRLVKPPLTYWLIGLSQAAFGVNEFAARLPSMILALLCPIALMLAFAARGDPFAGLLAGLALLTSPQWLMLGRFATPDMPLASLLGMLLAVVIAFPAFEGVKARTALGMIAVALLAGAMLTDGPRGLLLPVWSVVVWAGLHAARYGWGTLTAVVATYAIGQRIHSGPLNLVSHGFAIVAAALAFTKLVRLPARRLAAGCALLIVLVAPWYLAVLGAEPVEAAANLLGYKHALNLGEDLGEHTESLAFVARVVSMGCLPWIGASLVGLICALRARRRQGPELTTAAAAIGVLLFFTASEAKMGHFYGVAQPALAGLAGFGLAELSRRRDWTLIPGLIALATTCACVVWSPRRLLDSVTVFTDLHERVDPVPWMLGTVALWLAFAAIGIATGKRAWLIACSIPAAVFAGFLALRVVPALEAQKSFRPMWVRYDAQYEDGEPLAVYGWTKDSAFYYSDNAVIRLKEPGELREFLGGAGRKFVIVPFEEFEELERAGSPGARWRVLLDDHAYHMLVEYSPLIDKRGDVSPQPGAATRHAGI